MSFNAGNSLLAVQSAEPDWKLTIWDWEIISCLKCVSTSPDMTRVKNIQYCLHAVDNESNKDTETKPNNQENEESEMNDDHPDNSILGKKRNNVSNSKWLVVCHSNQLKLYKLQGPLNENAELIDDFIELYPYETKSQWSCITWMRYSSQLIIAANTGGDVVVIQNFKFQEVILSKPGIKITALYSINNNTIAVGCDDCTIVIIQSSTIANDAQIDDREIQTLPSNLDLQNNENGIRSWTVVNTINIVDEFNPQNQSTSAEFKPIPIAISSDSKEKTLIISCTNRQIYSVNFAKLHQQLPANPNDKLPITSNTNINRSNTAKSANSASKLQLPLGHFHQGSITGLDTCVRKPLIVTCSAADKSIRIWNYATKCLEIVKYFPHPVYSVSFHPSGLHILAGFADKLKLLNVLMDDIKPYKDFHVVRGCTECQFSNGGHMFAAANGDKILIYATYSGELITVLRGHNQRVRSLYWNLDDTSLISAGAEGAVYEWDTQTFNRPQEHVNRQNPLNSAIITRDKKIYITGSSTHVISEIVDSQLEKEMDMGIEMTRIVISHLPQRMIFASTINGLVRSMKFPISNEHLDYIAHLGKISRMAINEMDTYLFTAGNDGCITLFEIRDKEGRASRRSIMAVEDESDHLSEELANLRQDAQMQAAAGSSLSNKIDGKISQGGENWSEEILVTISYLEDKKQLVGELKNKVDELKLHNEYQLRLREMHYQDTLKEKADKFNKELQSQKQKYEVLKDELQDMEMEYEEKIKLKEDGHAEQISQLEAFYQSQLMNEIEKYKTLEKNLHIEQNNVEKDMLNKIDFHKMNFENIEHKYETVLNQEMNKKNKLLNEKTILLQEFNETKSQLCDDFDIEISELKEKYDMILLEEREATLRLKGENGVMKKKFTSLQNEIEDQIEEARKMSQQESNFKKTIESLKNEINKLDSAMIQRDNVIGEKEKIIYELKKKNQNLEKHKFVLDYRIKALKKQIEPRTNRIAAMRDEVKILDLQLETLHSNNGQEKTKIDENTNQLNNVLHKIRTFKNKGRKLESILQRFGYDLTQCVDAIQNQIQLKENFLKMFESNRSIVKFDEKDVNPKIINEYARQKVHLQACVEALKHKLIKQNRKNKNENLQIMNENIQYMSEIQDLRKELKNLTQTKHKLSSNRDSNSNETDANNQTNQTKAIKHERLRSYDVARQQMIAEYQVTTSQLESLAQQIAALENKYELNQYDENCLTKN